MAEEKQPYSRGMVIMAHPDDADWGVSGTVARWGAQGWQVVYVICTNGNKGSDDPAMTSEKLAEIRAAEQREAARILGLQGVEFLGYEDAMLQPTLELRRDLARLIRKHQPDVVICGNPTRRLTGGGYLGHPDHHAAAEAALSAVFPTARDRLTFPELLKEGLEPHKVREVWITGHEDPDLYIDVTDYVSTGLAAIKAHRSQVTPEEADEYWPKGRQRTGEKVGMAYAEAFKRFKLD